MCFHNVGNAVWDQTRNVTPNYEFAPPKGNNSGTNAELKLVTDLFETPLMYLTLSYKLTYWLQ